MTKDIYNPQPAERTDTPTAGETPQPAVSSQPDRTMAVVADEDAADYRELMRILALPSEDDPDDDVSHCEALSIDAYLSNFDDGEE